MVTDFFYFTVHLAVVGCPMRPAGSNVVCWSWQNCVCL